jgi:hypothetical protein
MELTLNNNKMSVKSEANKFDYWNDSLIHEYYVDYYKDISSKELDVEFRKDVTSLSKVLSKLSDTEIKLFIDLLSKYIEFYISQKVEKELDKSIMQFLKF